MNGIARSFRFAKSLPGKSPRQLGACLLTSLLAFTASATSLQAGEAEDLFEIHVRPLLVKHCIQCHGENEQEGGLTLTTRDGLLAGGDSGPAITPGDADASLLVEALRYESLEMPPAGPVDAQLIDGVASWIAAGAAWPATTPLRPVSELTAADKQWWCYQPIADPPVPDLIDDPWCRNEIDAFVLRRLREAGLEPAAEAPSRELVRRLHFDLNGLPPAPDFSAERIESSEGFDAVVGELLERPAYGEHFARFWLDLVRYADSDGYNADHARPRAHQYRDYVIDALNQDLPYDQFVREQLAGDEIAPGDRRALVATMYLRHYIYEWNQRDVETQWDEILSDITETTADVFLAQGLKCARCHDHKFDPLLQRDHFRLRAFFEPFYPSEAKPIADLEGLREYQKAEQRWLAATENVRLALEQIERPVLLQHATREGFDKFNPRIQGMLLKPEWERTPYEKQIASLAARQFELHPEKLEQWLPEGTRDEWKRLRAELAKSDHLKPEPLETLAFVGTDVGPRAPPTFLGGRVDGPLIEPGFPTILDPEPAEIPQVDPALRSTGRRTALADWIVDPSNPLTARVIVNRVWQQHFGRGLVATTSDFGRLGQPPSHPELLDWLATRFMEDGWSLKRLHARIVQSAAFRQSSRRPIDAKIERVDPQNRLLWRMPPRRLTGEQFHDAILVAAGNDAPSKRAVYKTVKRNRLDPFLAAFDFPDRVRSQGRRHRTTTSPQALLMMNDPWVHERAAEMAAVLPEGSFAERLQAAYRRLVYRDPTANEIDLAEQFFNAQRQRIEAPDEGFAMAELPSRGPAMLIDADEPPRIELEPFAPGADGSEDFTVAAIVELRSLYEDAKVRTIAGNWDSRRQTAGWSIGVTSTKSAFDPRNLIVQLIGKAGDGDALTYEVVASDLRIKLNRPYAAAVAVNLNHDGPGEVTFWLRDLSNPQAKTEVVRQKTSVRSGILTPRPIAIGSRGGQHAWDGALQRVQFVRQPLSETAWSLSDWAGEAGVREATQAVWADLRFDDPHQLGGDVSPAKRAAPVTSRDAKRKSPQQQAWAALLHILISSNEVLYVD